MGDGPIAVVNIIAGIPAAVFCTCGSPDCRHILPLVEKRGDAVVIEYPDQNPELMSAPKRSWLRRLFG